MRYFTKEMWTGWQNDSRTDMQTDWETRLGDYRRQLNGLRERLTTKGMQFFEKHSLHDGRLAALLISDPAALNHPVRRRRSASDVPVTLEFHVVRREGDKYTLKYSGVRKINVDFPSDQPLFNVPADGFGDWGYDEVTAADNLFLRHEVLFASGATILVEFNKFQWNRVRVLSRPPSALSKRSKPKQF